MLFPPDLIIFIENSHSRLSLDRSHLYTFDQRLLIEEENDLGNAAKIDGANVFQRYLLITIPLCVPILILYHYRQRSTAYGAILPARSST